MVRESQTGQYLGFLRSVKRVPFVAILYCYFDESGKQSDHPVVTVAGVCATESKLKSFDDEWNILLRQYGLPFLHMAKASRTREKVGDKMPRGQTTEERSAALLPFADCINSHLEVGLIQAMDVEGFKGMSKNARARLGDPNDPYHMSFARAMLEVVKYVPKGDRVSLICDDDPETAWDCYRHYRGVRRAVKEVREKTVSLTFANDEYFPALQAADMVAFLARLEAKAVFYGDKYSYRKLFHDLATTRGVSQMQWLVMFADKARCRAVSDSIDKKRRPAISGGLS